MLDLRANVRVIPEAAGQQRPATSRVKEAADHLSTLGFKVVRLGRFGVSVEASEDQFVRVLGVRPFHGGSGTRSINSEDGKLKDLVDQVEMSPLPEFW